MPDRLKISLKRNPAMVVSKVAIGDEKLVYVACASRKLRYPKGNSPVVYIGTTKKGAERLFSSAAYRADDILNIHAVDSFEVRVITCRPRQNVKTWLRLERAMLVAFKERYGDIPRCNVHGAGMTEDGVFDLFARSRVMAILEGLEESGEAEGRPVTADGKG
ncbi:Uncharacterised protein [Roseomonas gilardii subsp. rosea]|nr:Uncharacterised protein [Roseomonas gilardii subsp. rosea]